MWIRKPSQFQVRPPKRHMARLHTGWCCMLHANATKTSYHLQRHLRHSATQCTQELDGKARQDLLSHQPGECLSWMAGRRVDGKMSSVRYARVDTTTWMLLRLVGLSASSASTKQKITFRHKVAGEIAMASTAFKACSLCTDTRSPEKRQHGEPVAPVVGVECERTMSVLGGKTLDRDLEVLPCWTTSTVRCVADRLPLAVARTAVWSAVAPSPRAASQEVMTPRTNALESDAR